MTKQQLKNVMKYYLIRFNDERVSINDNTIHNTVLDGNDGWGSSNSKDIYKNLVRWSLAQINHVQKTWPSSWMTMSVEDVADAIY
jgi:hypothetical protein